MSKKSIPMSNKPGAKVKPEKPGTDDKAKVEAFQAKVMDTITKIRPMVDEVEAAITKTEATKVMSVHSIGSEMNKLLATIGKRERSLIVKRFHKEVGMDISFFYLAMQVSNRITRAQLKALQKKNITMRALKALVGVSDEKIFEKSLAKALSEGITADEIRQDTGKKNTRSKAFASKQREKNKKKPPMRVFSQGLDRTVQLEHMLGSCTDAVVRLSECKTEDHRVEAVKVLVELRKRIPTCVSELGAFMKYTANISK